MITSENSQTNITFEKKSKKRANLYNFIRIENDYKSNLQTETNF